MVGRLAPRQGFRSTFRTQWLCPTGNAEGGSPAHPRAGWPAGDTDGDGFADVLAGGRIGDRVDGASGGEAYLYRGGIDGLPAQPSSILEHAPPGDAATAIYEAAPLASGDLDGDGYD